MQRTLAIVKPDAVAKNATGDIIATIEANGFRILGDEDAAHHRKQEAEGFYAVHADKPFFDSLTNFYVERADRGARAGEGRRD